jgi:thioredoxin-like negative regulator of GroEL
MQRISKNWFLSQNFRFLWISIQIHASHARWVVGDIEDDYEGKLNVYKVNVNFDESLASKYEVLAAPTFVAFNKGAETGRIAGKTTKDALLGLFEGLV